MRLYPWFAVLLLAACSSTPERAEHSAPEEKKAASQTDQCLDNPDLARSWGDCNVKQTVFLASTDLAACRKASPAAKGTLNLELRIKGDGFVKSAKAVSGPKGKLSACVAKVMKKLRFAPPPNGKTAKINVPYQLEP